MFKLYQTEISNESVTQAKNVNMETNPGPLSEAFSRVNENDKKRMCNVFNIAYFLAKEQKPLSDMEKQCVLAKKLGVDIGNNYHNDFSASQSIGAISGNLKDDVASDIANCRFICVLI